MVTHKSESSGKEICGWIGFKRSLTFRAHSRLKPNAGPRFAMSLKLQMSYLCWVGDEIRVRVVVDSFRRGDDVNRTTKISISATLGDLRTFQSLPICGERWWFFQQSFPDN